MEIQKNARLLIIVTVVLVLMMAFAMSDKTRPIQKNVSYNSTIFQELKLYKGTLYKCNYPCANLFGIAIPLMTATEPIVFKDIVTIDKDEVEYDSYRSDYTLCDMNNTCKQYTNILDIDKTKYTKNIPVGIEIKYRKVPDGFETKKRWEWLLSEVIDE